MTRHKVLDQGAIPLRSGKRCIETALLKIGAGQAFKLDGKLGSISRGPGDQKQAGDSRTYQQRQPRAADPTLIVNHLRLGRPRYFLFHQGLSPVVADD